MDGGELRLPEGAERWVCAAATTNANAAHRFFLLPEKEAKVAKEKELGIYKEKKVGRLLLLWSP